MGYATQTKGRMQMEIWKDIPGFEGLYQASNEGRIRSVEGKMTSSRRFKERHWKSRILKTRGKAVSGYRVSLWKDGKPYDRLIARMVALTFLGEPPEKFTVNHIDGNKYNNKIENLEWISLQDNIKHQFANGLDRRATPTSLMDKDGNRYDFPTMMACCRFLNRNQYYIRSCRNRNANPTSKSGQEYILLN